MCLFNLKLSNFPFPKGGLFALLLKWSIIIQDLSTQKCNEKQLTYLKVTWIKIWKKEGKEKWGSSRQVYIHGEKTDGINYGTSSESQRINNSKYREILQGQDEKGMVGKSRQWQGSRTGQNLPRWVAKKILLPRRTWWLLLKGKIKSWFSEKINKMDKPLATLTKKKKEREKMTRFKWAESRMTEGTSLRILQR